MGPGTAPTARAHTTPRLVGGWRERGATGWEGWSMVSSVYNVSSVQCHTMASCPRGEEGVQAGPVVTPVIMISPSLTV